MKLKIVDGVKKRIHRNTIKELNSTTETSVNYINICFLKYLNYWIKSNAVSGGFYE